VFCINVSASTSPELLSHKAVSENSTESAAAISELRKLGPSGFSSLLKLHSAEVERHLANPLEPSTPEWERLSAALDAVSQQRNSYVSKLFWYTDLAQAEAAARTSGKPI